MGILDVNKQLVLRGIEAWNSGDLEAVARLTHPDFFDHGGTAPGPESRLEPLDIVAEDDRVVVRGRVARVGGPVQEIHIWRLAAGLIVEHWQGSDGPPVDQREKEE